MSVLEMRFPSALLSVMAAAWLIGCGDTPGEAGSSTPIEAPQRTAAQDRALRALVGDMAAERACDALDRAFVPVPEERAPAARADEQPAVVGRLWVSDCNVTRRGEHLVLRVGGRGWQWIDRTGAGPLGTSFSVRGHLRFQASIELDASVDLRYDEASHRALVALTPARPVRARVTPIGTLPVVAEGGWSGLLGGLGTMLGTSVQDQARPMVEQHGAAMLGRQLRGGATLALDLCTGQPDATLGAVADGAAPPSRPYPTGEQIWIDNARVVLRAGAMDLAGPFASEGRRLSVDLDVQSGGAVELAFVCREEAERLAADYLSSGAQREPRVLARTSVERGTPGTLALEAGACAEPVVLVRSNAVETRYRYRVRREGDAARALVGCGG